MSIKEIRNTNMKDVKITVAEWGGTTTSYKRYFKTNAEIETFKKKNPAVISAEVVGFNPYMAK